MAENKIIFIAFAIEDVRQRDFLKGQSLLDHSPFEYIVRYKALEEVKYIEIHDIEANASEYDEHTEWVICI